MKERYNDTDLREALRRKFAEEPELPEDFVEQVMQRSKALPTMRWRWMAAAACILIIISVGVTLWPDVLPDLRQGEPTSVEAVVDLRQEEPTSVEAVADLRQGEPTSVEAVADLRQGEPTSVEVVTDSRQGEPTSVEAVADSRQGVPTSVEAVADLRQEEPTSVEAVQIEYAQQTNRVQQAEPLTEVLTERDIPITRPENYKYTPEEIALMKKQAREAYLKWVELELEIAKYNQEQTANNYRDL